LLGLQNGEIWNLFFVILLERNFFGNELSENKKSNNGTVLETETKIIRIDWPLKKSSK